MYHSHTDVVPSCIPSASDQVPRLSGSDAGHTGQAHCPGSHLTHSGADTQQAAGSTHGYAR